MPCKCKLFCKTLSHAWRSKLFRELHKLQTENEQGTYVLGFMSTTGISRRRNGKYTDPNDSRRQCTIRYNLPTQEGKSVQVCKATFMDTFGLKHRFLQTLQSRRKKGISLYKDQRGKHERVSKYSANDREAVITDINCYPRETSHYGRQKSRKEYLSSDLSVNRMFKNFKIKHPQSIVNYKFYYKIFHSFKPKLSFHQPRVDTCSDCDKLKHQILSGDNRAKIILQTHHRCYRRALNEMNKDHTEAKQPGYQSCVMSIDLQQVIQLPTLTHSEMYYSRQLNFYNLGIHIGNTDEAYCCLWHEGQAGRGSAEIASCLLKLINEGYINHKKLIIWSDNCPGQNKNRTMLFLMIWLVCVGIFSEVQHKFLLKGHTFLACDRDFGHIEKRKRKSQVLIPKDLCKVISDAKYEHQLTPLMMHSTNFFDFTKTADTVIDTKKIGISKACLLKINASNPTVVAYKHDFLDFEQWKYCNVLKKKQNN